MKSETQTEMTVDEETKKEGSAEKSPSAKESKKSQKKEENEEKSPSAKKSKKSQKKDEAAPKPSVERTKDEAEEFENVNAQVRPAKSKLRTTILRWKTGEDAEGTEESIHQSSAEATTGTSTGSTSQNKSHTSSSDTKSQTADRVTAIRQKSENERTLADIPILLKRIAELESAQSKALMVQKRLRMRIRDKQRTIKELTEALNAPQPAVKAIDEEEKVSKADEKIAKRALEGIRKEQLLEKAVTFREMKMVRKFFDAPEVKPDQRVVRIIDKALGFAIDDLLQRSQPTGGLVDNEMRLFLLEKTKAKRILLSVMLQNPEFIPECWGGETARRTQKTPVEKSVEKAEGESEKTILKTTRQVLGYIFDTEARTSERSVELEASSMKADKEKKTESKQPEKAETQRRKSKEK